LYVLRGQVKDHAGLPVATSLEQRPPLFWTRT